tara:strand:- start:2005 stop:2109 length:105 start_codon:yes stop_codon:yes gene_type:complete
MKTPATYALSIPLAIMFALVMGMVFIVDAVKGMR